jgi:hypothetical protein
MAATASSSNDGGQDSESEEFFDLSDNEEGEVTGTCIGSKYNKY